MSMVKIRAALETALASMGETIPSFTIASSTAGGAALITSAVPHGLKTDVSVTISGHTGSNPSLNGTYLITVLNGSSFTLRNKVTGNPVASTANGVGGVCKPNLTAWDNVSFNPVPGLPYQKVHVVFADPENTTMGSSHYRELGFMQVTLLYPILVGTYDVTTRIELIRKMFARGASFAKDGVTVNIPKTPMVMTGIPIDESYAVPVRIQFYADIFE